ncbi:hypothetical protein Taro_046174 [Colocasia esculenta]|uniref:Uncharacterized protein n=1 Tax=Colocasia esculenta TaxID=4460 RepID=A0A843WP50_COLES|nr:hypothetical protein [Colocasia esculenta]
MDEDGSFRWHDAWLGDTIEIFNGSVTDTNKVGFLDHQIIKLTHRLTCSMLQDVDLFIKRNVEAISSLLDLRAYHGPPRPIMTHQGIGAPVIKPRVLELSQKASKHAWSSEA